MINLDTGLVYYGASVEDKPGESGLLVTSPDGETYEVPGRVERPPNGNQELYFFTTNEGQKSAWQQVFTPEGTLEINKVSLGHGDSSLGVTISRSGELSISGFDDSGTPLEARMEGPALVMQGKFETQAVVPAVPVEWFMGK